MCNYMCLNCYPSFVEKFTADVMPMNIKAVVNQNAVSSRRPEITIEFALALVECLYGREKMEEVDGPLVSCES